MSISEQLVGNLLEDDLVRTDRLPRFPKETRPSPLVQQQHPIQHESVSFLTSQSSHQSFQDASSLPEAVDPKEAYRYTIDYFAYYFSLRNIDPRLPMPLITWEQYNYAHAAQLNQRKMDESHLHYEGGGMSQTPNHSNVTSIDWNNQRVSSPSLVDKIQSDFPTTPSHIVSGGSPVSTTNTYEQVKQPRVSATRTHYITPQHLPPATPIDHSHGLHLQPHVQGHQQMGHPQMGFGYSYPSEEEMVFNRMGKLSLQDKSRRRQHLIHNTEEPEYLGMPHGGAYFPPGPGFGTLYSHGVQSYPIPSGPQLVSYPPNGPLSHESKMLQHIHSKQPSRGGGYGKGMSVRSPLLEDFRNSKNTKKFNSKILLVILKNLVEINMGLGLFNRNLKMQRLLRNKWFSRKYLPAL